jgi:cell division septation protein DedD
MAQTDEKELVLGNKQLISLFFVAVALCGVFFAMGYMIGRNSTKATVASAVDASTSSVGQRTQPDPPRETPPSQPETSTTPPPETAPAAAAPENAPPGETRPVETKPVEATPPPPRAEPKEYSKVAADAKRPGGVSTPEAGASYVQAISTSSRSDAESIVQSLREKNFTALVAAGAKEGTFRVLVGPYHQTGALADAKQRVQKLGFGGAFVYKP